VTAFAASPRPSETVNPAVLAAGAQSAVRVCHAAGALVGPVNAGRKSDSSTGGKSDGSTRGRASGRRDLLTGAAPTAGRRIGFVAGVQGLPQLGVIPQAVAVAANRHQVAVVDEAIDERRRALDHPLPA